MVAAGLRVGLLISHLEGVGEGELLGRVGEVGEEEACLIRLDGLGEAEGEELLDREEVVEVAEAEEEGRQSLRRRSRNGQQR